MAVNRTWNIIIGCSSYIQPAAIFVSSSPLSPEMLLLWTVVTSANNPQHGNTDTSMSGPPVHRAAICKDNKQCTYTIIAPANALDYDARPLRVCRMSTMPTEDWTEWLAVSGKWHSYRRETRRALVSHHPAAITDRHSDRYWACAPLRESGLPAPWHHEGTRRNEGADRWTDKEWDGSVFTVLAVRWGCTIIAFERCEYYCIKWSCILIIVCKVDSLVLQPKSW